MEGEEREGSEVGKEGGRGREGGEGGKERGNPNSSEALGTVGRHRTSSYVIT